MRKALFQNTELTTRALKQGEDRPQEEQGGGAGPDAADRQTLQPVGGGGGGAAGQWARGRGPRHWVPPLGAGTTAPQGRRGPGAPTLWQGSTEQMSPTSRSCSDISSSARSVQ